MRVEVEVKGGVGGGESVEEEKGEIIAEVAMTIRKFQ